MDDNIVDDLQFFDCNVRLGRLSVPGFTGWLDVAGLLSEMAYYGIAESLVVSTYGKEHHAGMANVLLTEQTNGYSTLWPCFVVSPAHPGVDPLEEEQVAR